MVDSFGNSEGRIAIRLLLFASNAALLLSRQYSAIYGIYTNARTVPDGSSWLRSSCAGMSPPARRAQLMCVLAFAIVCDEPSAGVVAAPF